MLAERQLKQMLTTCTQPSVSFSWGKNSSGYSEKQTLHCLSNSTTTMDELSAHGLVDGKVLAAIMDLIVKNVRNTVELIIEMNFRRGRLENDKC